MTIDAKFRILRGAFVLDVDLSVPSHGVTAVFGPSGSGKTTLLRAIAGLERHQGGFLKVGDTTWQAADRFVPPHRRPLGYVFQEASLFAHLTVRRNLEYGVRRVAKAQRKISTGDAIKLLGIGHLLERKPDTLSGGERQRVAIARALAVSPRLLLMDEPLTALDQASKQDILPYLESLHDELDIPVLYVSHTRDEVARLADHLVLLRDGCIIASGPINAMLTRLDLPLARGRDAEVVIDAVIAGHDEDYHLTYLDCDDLRFFVTRQALGVGDHVRLRLAARDISITLKRHAATSILNVFPATVEELTPEAEGQTTVRLMMGSTPVLSRITYKSARALGLTGGKRVYVQIKSVALLR